MAVPAEVDIHYKLTSVEGHKSVQISFQQAISDAYRAELTDVMEDLVRHYSRVSWDASNLLRMFLLYLLDVEDQRLIPEVCFDKKFFDRLLSSCELEGVDFERKQVNARSAKKYKDFYERFEECVKLFRERYHLQMPQTPMPAQGDLKYKSLTQIKSYVSKQMLTNFNELFKYNMNKYFDKPQEADTDDEVEESTYDKACMHDRDGFIFLFNKLNDILLNNVSEPDKQQRLLHLSPLFKCCARHIHLDSKEILEHLRKKLGAESHATMFSKRVHQLNKRVYMKMRTSINEHVPREARDALFQTLGFPDEFAEQYLQLSDLFNATANNSKTRTVTFTHDLKLIPDFNKFGFSMQTNAIGCTLCWNWKYQYPVIDLDFKPPTTVTGKRMRLRKVTVAKPLDVFASFDPSSPQATEPYWRKGRQSISSNLMLHDPTNYDVVLFMDPGKVYFMYGARMEKPSHERLQGLLDDCDPDIPYVRRHVKYWLRGNQQRIPFKTHPSAVKWLQPISRNVGSFSEFLNIVFPKLYDPNKYSRIWCGTEALGFKKMYRRGCMERDSNRRHKRELIWKYEVTNHNPQAKVLVIVGNAHLSWKNTSTSQGSAPAKSLYDFFRQKGAHVVEVDEYYTSQTCGVCDVWFGKKVPMHYHDLRDTDTEEVEMFFNDQTQKVEIKCRDPKCRLQICRNQDCKRPLDARGNKSFARDANSCLCIMKCYLFSLFKQDNCARYVFMLKLVVILHTVHLC